MAQDFEIFVQMEGEDVHLKLKGDFDGISAHELLDALATSCAPCSQVYIHSGSLKTLDQFGLQVFHSHFDHLKGTSLDLAFTGEHAFKSITKFLILAVQETDFASANSNITCRNVGIRSDMAKQLAHE